jgi:ArsR family transcriptional regulator
MAVLEQVAPVIRHAAHPLRLRILDYLRVSEEPQPVGSIVEACGTGQAIVSQQLRILKDQGVLSSHREGSNVLYRIENANVLLLLECIRRHQDGVCGSGSADQKGRGR